MRRIAQLNAERIRMYTQLEMEEDAVAVAEAAAAVNCLDDIFDGEVSELSERDETITDKDDTDEDDVVEDNVDEDDAVRDDPDGDDPVRVEMGEVEVGIDEEDNEEEVVATHNTEQRVNKESPDINEQESNEFVDDEVAVD